MSMTRREVLRTSAALAGTAALSGLSVSALAQQSKKIVLLAQRVHKTVAEGPQGGNVTAAWTARTGNTIEWLTFDTAPLQDRLFREASLGSSDINIAYLLNTWANPSAANLLEPLDSYQASKPIEEFADFFPGPVKSMTLGGKLVGIPMRHATAGLHYNAEFFEERGLSGPPRSMEELLEYAKKLTYTRKDGTPVVGFVIPNNYSNIVHMARAWNGDFITQDYKVTASDPAMVGTIAALRALFAAGAFPREFPSLLQEEVNTWMQNGRAAMVITNMSRNAQFNSPERSKFPGKIVTTTVPISETLREKFEVAPVGTEFWSFVIPKNSKNKDVSWDLIREMSSKENTRKAALNGNGPMRNSLYDDPDYAKTLPYSAAERKALLVARPPMPAFDGAPKAADLIREEFEAAVLGFKEPQEAMDDLSKSLKPLMPK